MPLLQEAPPSDAIVLFDGKDLSQWVSSGKDGKTHEPQWKVENGYMEITPHSGGSGDQGEIRRLPAAPGMDDPARRARRTARAAATAAWN